MTEKVAKTKLTDAERHKRFVEMARELFLNLERAWLAEQGDHRPLKSEASDRRAR